MNKESIILKKLIVLTINKTLEWGVEKHDSFLRYSTDYKITDDKLINIQYDHFKDRKEDYVVFNFSNKNKSMEIKDVFPYRMLSRVSYIQLSMILKKLYKEISKIQLKKEISTV